MLKSAIEKIESMALPIIHEVGGRTFATGPNGTEEIRPELDVCKTLVVSSLDALVKLILSNDCPVMPLYINVPSYNMVTTYTQECCDLRNQRFEPYLVKSTDVPGWDATVQMGFEEAMIALRSRFQESSDIDYALKLLSDITTGSKVTFNDNGVATSIVTQSGIALQSNQQIRPIINLRPYRTFQEVEQPESKFLIRISERGIKFIEADGGMWKLKARQTVKEWLQRELKDKVESGEVIIAL